MKLRKVTAILTLVLAHFILAFAAFTHVVDSLLVLPGGISLFEFIGQRVVATFVPDFGVMDELIGFIIAALVLGTALILALVWAVRLLVFRRKAGNQFGPLLFLVAIIIGFMLVIISPAIEAAFVQVETRISSAYWFVSGVVIVALALHLLVVGLKSSGSVKEASLIPATLEDEFILTEEVVLSSEKETIVAEEDDEVVVKEVLEDEVEESPHVQERVTVVREHVSDEVMRRIANEEIDKRLASEKVVAREVAPKVEPVKEEPKKVEKPLPAPKPEPKKTVAPPPPAPAVVKEKVERLAFPARMQIVEDQVKVDYNELKSYLLSFGLNSRVSNVADSFRQGRVLYAKLTNSGNSGLKLYLPINLDDYKDSKIPLKSAEGTKQYEDVPIFIYIRSELSMKRAKQLIDDVMLKNGISRKFDAEVVDHVKELA